MSAETKVMICSLGRLCLRQDKAPMGTQKLDFSSSPYLASRIANKLGKPQEAHHSDVWNVLQDSKRDYPHSLMRIRFVDEWI